MFDWYSKSVLQVVGTMLLEDKSSNDIAERLSAIHNANVTRNMVISRIRSSRYMDELTREFGPRKTNRMLRLWKCRKSSPRNATAKPVTRRPAEPGASKTEEAPKRRGRPPGSKNKAKPVPEFKQASEDEEVVTNVVAYEDDTIRAVLEIRGHECKWPIGDPLHPGFTFCGKQALTKSSYCRDHSKVAHGPAVAA